MTAVEKAGVVADMGRLVRKIEESGTSEKMPAAFTARLYEHLSMHCGHIAHYDRAGFWSAQLSTAKRALSFFEDMGDERLVAWSVHEYRDVNGAIVAVVKERMEALRK